MKPLIPAMLLFIASPTYAQTILNSEFNSGATNWGCSPEATNVETTYGGSDPTNRVAEVDAAASLCQTITGFTIGAQYNLDFDCSRRTNCGPTIQSMSITIDGGALSANVSRNGTPFSFQGESFSFVATATTHTISFTGTSSTTCGLILDNIMISTLLPVELLHFTATPTQQSIELNWSTATETNNAFFDVEHSTNGQNWQKLETVEGKGTMLSTSHYALSHTMPPQGYNYYRLKQVDLDGVYTYSPIVVTAYHAFSKQNIHVFPNPSTQSIQLTGPTAERNSFQLFDLLGQEITATVNIQHYSNYSKIDLSNLNAGIYVLKTQSATRKIQKQ